MRGSSGILLRAVLFGEQEQFKVRKIAKVSRAAVSRLVVIMELRLTPSDERPLQGIAETIVNDRKNKLYLWVILQFYFQSTQMYLNGLIALIPLCIPYFENIGCEYKIMNTVLVLNSSFFEKHATVN